MAALAMRLRSFFESSGFYSAARIVNAQTLGMKERYFQGPAASDALRYDILTNACFARPVLCDHLHTHERDPHVCAAITVLLGARNPAAILRSVVAVIVGAVKAVANRAWTNVGAEVPKADTLRRFAPAFANRNASTAVAVEVRSRRAIATPQHVFVEIVKLMVESRRLHAV